MKSKRGVTEMQLCKLEDVSKSLPCRVISTGWCFAPENEVIVSNLVRKVENLFGCLTKHWFFDTMLFSQMVGYIRDYVSAKPQAYQPSLPHSLLWRRDPLPRTSNNSNDHVNPVRNSPVRKEVNSHGVTGTRRGAGGPIRLRNETIVFNLGTEMPPWTRKIHLPSQKAECGRSNKLLLTRTPLSRAFSRKLGLRELWRQPSSGLPQWLDMP
jgi:hypothetical protein